ncbi:hypothetical protein RBG11_004270 [Vibrio parahaemolyticus]|nr:hypothetical protein [Vibrio parahaemolyticus]
MAKKPNNKVNSGKSNNIVLPRKLAKKAASQTSTSRYAKGTQIRNSALTLDFESIKNIKSSGKTIDTIRYLTDNEALSSYSLFSLIQLADSPLKIVAYELGTNRVSVEGTEIARTVLANLDTLSDYSKGYADKPSLRSLIHTMFAEIPQTGGVGCELVLNQYRLPERIQVFDYSTVIWESDGDGGRKPTQKSAGAEAVSLDMANIFISELHKESHEAYSAPLFKSSLNATVATLEFIEDMRRAVNRTGHSRLVVSLDLDKVVASAKEEVRADTAKLQTYLDNVLEDVRSELAELAPEDCVVTYNTVTAAVEDTGGTKTDYVPLMTSLSNYQATSMKTPTSVIGLRSEGSQSLSNTETLVYLKGVKAVQTPVEEVLSRALTLAVRLYGFDGYVRVKFQPIDLRPESELEAYKVQKQTRNLELLSLGVISDYQFCLEMGIDYNPDMPPLSGTFFHQKAKKSVEGVESDQPDDTKTDNTGGMESTLNSDTPKKGGGKSQ